MTIMSWFKKKPQRYCEDCRWYKESVTKQPGQAFCSHYDASTYAKVSRDYDASTYAKVPRDYISGTSCILARSIGHCGKNAKHFESNGKQAALSDI
jgi:hypothetical protein